MKRVLPQDKGVTMELLNCSVALCATKGKHKPQKPILYPIQCSRIKIGMKFWKSWNRAMMANYEI